MTWQLIHADCIEAMRELGEASVDAIVTDPPYGLEFMGKEWDRIAAKPRGRTAAMRLDEPTIEHQNDSVQHRAGVRQPGFLLRCARCGGNSAGEWNRCRCEQSDFRSRSDLGQAAQEWHTAWAAEALRVLKPGGHLLSFGGTRTYHRLACALEDAGFEIRDCLAWLYGSGFPKSLDVSKAIDKAAGAAREVVGTSARHGGGQVNAYDYGNGKQTMGNAAVPDVTAPATPDAERWQGWGTALKPAFEPIVLARRPLSGTVAETVLEFGTGALNVDGTRIEGVVQAGAGSLHTFHGGEDEYEKGTGREYQNAGRWPANVLLDADAAAALDEQSGESRSLPGGRVTHRTDLFNMGEDIDRTGYADFGGASRFFYTAKTSRAERENGVAQYGEAEERPLLWSSGEQSPGTFQAEGTHRAARNNHPTVKPVDLMQWLCRLITPPKGLILDPFTGSGSTGIAALREGFSFIGIEREPDYVEIARARIIGDAPLFNSVEA